MRLNFTFNSFLFLFVFLFSTIEGFSQCSITTSRNTTGLSCGTSPLSTCGGILYIGDGTNAMTLTIDSGFNLSCLGVINLVIRNNATILFGNGANDRITLAEGSTITVNSGANIDGGNQCTASDRIYIGELLVSTCNGQANSNTSFDDLESLGGTGSVMSNSPVCVGSSINLTATPPPNGTFTFSWTGPNSFTSTLQNPTFAAVASSTGEYNVVMTRTSDSKKAYGRVTVTVNSLPTVAAIGGGATEVCVNSSTPAFTNATSGGTWSVANETGTASITTGGVVTGMTAGTVTVNYTVSNGTCSNTATKSLTVNSLPAQPTLSSVTQPTCSVANGSFTITNYDSSYSYTITPSTEVTRIGANVTASTGSYTITATNDGCTSSATNFTINGQPATPTQPTLSAVTQPTCSVANGTFTITNYSSAYTYSVNPSVGVVISGSTITAPAGTYTVTATSGSCSSIVSSSLTVNSQPITPSVPTAGTPTNPTCKIPTGSVPLNGLPASGTIIQTGDRNDSYTITGGGTQIITNLLPGTYYFSVENGSCTSASVSVTIIAPVTNTWSTGSWSDGTPTINQRLVFASNYTNANDVDLEGCSCQVAGSAVVTIKSGRTLKIENGVDVQPNASLIFENNASLVQINDDPTINSGNITYHRYTAAVKRYDFTYWSSPVAGQTLKALSPNTLFDKYYSYDNGWKISYYGTATMVAGRGYLIRAPQTFSITAASVDTNPTFIGKPNNGVVSFFIAGSQVHLLGNPYPSAIDADAFLDENETVLEGTLYFWTHNSPPSINVDGDAIYNYTTNDYATYNRTGGVGTAPAKVDGDVNDPNNNNNLSTPNGKIAAGQGFFAPAKASGDVIFNNRMRLSSSGTILNNSQFFKLSNSSKTTTARTEKSRIWLNLTNKEGAYKQMLIGYITGATNNYDAGFDGVTYDGNQYVDFYSVNNAVNLAIQGRALPFVKQDSVALGYKSAIAGDFQISIDHVDGVLETQNIFLEDKTLNVLHDLRKGSYAFTTAKGVFNDRFVLRYVDKNAVEEVADSVVSEELSNEVVASVKDGVITVSSTVAALKTVIIYNVSGGIVYQQDTVNADELVIPQLISSHQVLVVTIVLSDGTALSRKIIY